MFRYAFIAGLLLCLYACNRNRPDTGDLESFHATGDPAARKEAFEVIYALSLPTDITRLFEETGTGFDPGLLIPLDRIALFEHPGKMALLMGGLGVDMSYCRLFGMGLEAARCYEQAELLAGRLGLPAEIFDYSDIQLEQYMDQPDSLAGLITGIYTDIDAYFRISGQESMASLSLLGGWMEAMYIGVNIYQNRGIVEMGDRILHQKYALNSLTGLLANYQESLMVRKYMHHLNKLSHLYDDVDIRYAPDGFSMERERRLFRASHSEISCSPENMERICRLVVELRSELVR
jgi:hypothetical protein